MKYLPLYMLLSFFLFAQDKGQSLYNDKNFEEAIRYYESILDKKSDFDAAKFGIGASAYQLGEKETAISIFNDISSYADSSLKSKALYNIATLMNEKNKLKESLTYLRKSIELDPQNENAKINYELLKRMIEQKNQSSNSNEDSGNDEKSDQSNRDEGQDENSGNDEKSDQSNRDEGQDENSGGGKKSDQSNRDEGQDENSGNSEKDDQNNKELAQKRNDSENKGKEGRANQNNELGKKSDKNKNPNFDKTDKQLQAEAILEALKDNEKINQRRKISGKKSLKLSKDW